MRRWFKWASPNLAILWQEVARLSFCLLMTWTIHAHFVLTCKFFICLSFGHCAWIDWKPNLKPKRHRLFWSLKVQWVRMSFLFPMTGKVLLLSRKYNVLCWGMSYLCKHCDYIILQANGDNLYWTWKHKICHGRW